TPPRGEEGAARVELLDTVVIPIGGGVGPAPVDRHAPGDVELAGARAFAPPHGKEGAARVELLDAAVVRSRDGDVPAARGRRAAWGGCWRGAWAAPGPPQGVGRVPPASNFWMRWLSVSATCAFPLPPIATPEGWRNSPPASLPHVVRKVPLASNFWIRL